MQGRWGLAGGVRKRGTPRGVGSILEQQMQRIAQRKNHIVEHDLILVHAAHDVHHDVALALVQHDPVVVEVVVGGLLGRLLVQAFLVCFLGF